MRRELTIATEKVVTLPGDMKDETKHRKRNKSESDSVKTEKTDATRKTSVAPKIQPPPQQQLTAQEARSRRISTVKMDHGHGQHPTAQDARSRRISHGRKISRDHGYHDDPHHMSGHPIRPRRDTMMSRGHSTHHGSDRRSTGSMEGNLPVVFYENTYKLTPDSRFHEGNVRNAIYDVLKENITETVYDPNMCGAKCKLLSEIIKERVKHLRMDRFKIISIVMIGQVFDQSMLVTSRCLWDHRFDNAVSVEYKKGDIQAVGLVFAVYHE